MSRQVFESANRAEAAALVPGVKHLAPRTVAFTSHPEGVFRVQVLNLYRLRYEPYAF